MRRIAALLTMSLLLMTTTTACDLMEVIFEEEPTPTPLVLVVTPTPTPIPPPTPTPVPPPCAVRTDWPVYTVVRGDTLYSIARRTGTTVEALMAANCLSGTLILAGRELRVPTLPYIPPPTDCGGVAWFFTFSAGQSAPGCPNPVQATGAVGEDFEGGRAYWYAAIPGDVNPLGTIYVIYNDHTWESYPNTWSPGQPASDPGIVPPAGRYQPERALGKLWRENPSVRARLGWAYEPESAFTGRVQTINTRVGSPPPGYVPHFYIDHGKGIVLRLYQDAATRGANTWEVAGGYQAAQPPPTSPPACTTQWFFTFKAGQSDPACPGPLLVVNAAGEDFEGGRVYWYAAPPGAADPRGTIYVIYNDRTWESFIDTWDESQPASDPGIVPPAGRYQPARGIGKLWRENPSVRARLGWAYEPESAFTGRWQQPVGQTGYFYIDHGKGIVLRLYSAGVNTWEVVGSY